MKGGHQVSMCVMCCDGQYGHGAGGDMNAGDNIAAGTTKRCLGCHSFYFLLSPVLLPVLVFVLVKGGNENSR